MEETATRETIFGLSWLSRVMEEGRDEQAPRTSFLLNWTRARKVDAQPRLLDGICSNRLVVEYEQSLSIAQLEYIKTRFYSIPTVCLEVTNDLNFRSTCSVSRLRLFSRLQAVPGLCGPER